MLMFPLLGAFAWGAERKYRWSSVNAVSGATIKVPNSSLKDLKAPIASGKILDKTVSRVIAGGNLIGGWAHSRDLIYVSKLFKAYNTEKKVFETLAMAEQAGINTINILPVSDRPRHRTYHNVSSCADRIPVRCRQRLLYGRSRSMLARRLLVRPDVFPDIR